MDEKSTNFFFVKWLILRFFPSRGFFGFLATQRLYCRYSVETLPIKYIK